KLTPSQRFTLYSNQAPAGSKLTVTVMRGDTTFPVTLVSAAPTPTRQAQFLTDVAIPVCFFLSFAIASTLFLMRPSAAALLFYAYVMLMLLKVNQTTLDLAAWPLNVISYFAYQLVYPATQLMILLVAQRLYGRPSKGWRWFFGAAVVASLLTFFVWLDPMVWLTFQILPLHGPGRALEDLSDILLLSIVLCGVSYVASGVEGEERKRVVWIAAGIALSPLLDLAWAAADLGSGIVRDTSPALLTIRDWTDPLQQWIGLLGVVAVAYGFLSRRVVDIRVAVGRAAIYGAMTLTLLVLFGIVEWAAERLFEDTRPAMYVSLVAALLIGFGMNALHGRAEGLLDRLLFHEQHENERRLQRAARALANTSSEKTLLEFLIDEPVRALGLTSSALFLAEPNAPFERVAARGWSSDETETVDREDPLVLQLRTELSLVELHAWRPSGAPLPPGTKAPALAIPLVMRGDVFGFVFYGECENGLPLEMSEKRLLETIATSAAAAYDHIDAERSRARIAELEAQLKSAGAA
ncbi:MAG: hypothetical protein JO199_06840, partial [Candidatus Eremiobacteraeota bacterium]|nr:hypothetical protein [Candidatus Eremiobacteraeota bacterium]